MEPQTAGLVRVHSSAEKPDSPLAKDSVGCEASYDLNENLKSAFDKTGKRLPQPSGANAATSQGTSYHLLSGDDQGEAYHTQRFSDDGALSTLREFQLNLNSIKDAKQRQRIQRAMARHCDHVSEWMNKVELCESVRSRRKAG